MTNVLFPSVGRAPFTLPLDHEAFRLALQRGHGRAILHARQYGIADRIDDVVHACLHNLSYDPQCEDDRAEWMLQLVDAGGAEQAVVDRLLAGVAVPAGDENRSHHEAQRAHLMKLLALRGYAVARERLYALFRCSDPADVLGCEEIIALDGADGLVRACEHLGGWIAEGRVLEFGQSPLRHYDGQHGDGAALRVLEPLRQANASIARYLDYIAAACDGRDVPAGGAAPPNGPAGAGASSMDTRPVAKRTAAEIIAWIEACPDDLDAEFPAGSWLIHWGYRAPEAELRLVAERLRVETNPSRLYRYLRVFQRRPLPVVDPSLLALADHGNRHIRWVTYRVLSHFNDPRVRALALARLGPQGMREDALVLFHSSYAAGDHAAIERALFVPDNRDELHAIVFDLVDVFGAHPLPEARNLMLFGYEHSPCGNCRSGALEILASANVVPAWLREEAACDALDEIRSRYNTPP